MRPVLALVAVACSAPERARVTPPPVANAPLVAPGLRLPALATPTSYELRLDIDPSHEGFRGEVWIKTRIERPTDHVWLHMDELTITAARWTGGELALDPVAGEQMRAFRFGRVVQPGEYTLSFEFRGSLLGEQEGLFRQRADGRWYVYSQAESVFARRITPCFDEPQFKTPWRVSVVVPKGHHVVANMPEQKRRVLDDRQAEVTFEPTPPQPSYLLALAVGPFDVVDTKPVGRGKVPVRVLVPKGEGGKTRIVGAKLPAIVDAVEAFTGDGLRWPKLDLVAVPEFFGAMENPGLVTFEQSILVGDERDAAFASHFVAIAAHEIAHQWFGNLVTHAWWDDLWLSEAFASWLADKVTRELGAWDDVALRTALARREAYAADDALDVVPLRRVVTDTATADEGFDEIAYLKGSAVIATIEAWLGDDRFRTLVRDYLAKHRDRTATAADVYAALAAEPQLAAALRDYAEHAGVPVVELGLRCEGKPAIVALARQKRTVPVCVRYPAAAGKLAETCALVGERRELALDRAATCPAWIDGHARGGYYHVAWTTHGPRGPALPVAQLDPAARIRVGDELAAAVSRGELGAKAALAELRALAGSNDVYALLGAVALAAELDRYVDDGARPAWSAWLAARFADRLGAKRAQPAERELAGALLEVVPADRYPAANARAAVEMLDKIIADGSSRLPARLVAIAAPVGGDKLFARIADRARTRTRGEVRRQWLAALGHFGPAQIDRAADLLADNSLPPEDAWSALAGYFERPATRAAAWRALRPRVDKLLARMDTDDGLAVIDATAGLCERTARDEVAAAIEPRVAAIANGRARLDRALATIERCIATRAKLGDFTAALAASK